MYPSVKTRHQRMSEHSESSAVVYERHNVLVKVDGQTMRLDWITKTTKNATPLFVHVFMIVSVGLYAVMGAWCMQKIEGGTVEQIKSSNVVRRHATLPESFIDDGNFTRISSSPPDLPSAAPKHRRRRRGEDKVAAWGVPSSSSRHRRAAVELRRSRDCVVDVLKRLTSSESCGSAELDEKTATMLDACYRISVDKGTHTKDVIFMNSREEVESVGEEDEEVVPWSFVDALLFTFTVITTIGYGNVAPRTFEGRLFVIFYGLVGIPFTLLAIADLGKFLSEIMYTCSRAIRKGKKKLRALLASRSRYFRNSTFSFARISAREKSSDAANGSFMTKPLGVDDIVSIEEGSGSVSDPPDAPAVVIQGEDHVEEEDFIDDGQALSLFILFVVYIALGALILSQYEPDLDFFKAVYFNFVTLTSIGLGDIVPRSETYMFFTIAYIAVGLALTTIAIEIAADTLKRLHYFGRKIENVAAVPIWFGGKKLTMKALVKNLGDQFNLPTTVVKDLNLDTFVENAIKVEAGEMETLRPPPFDPDPEELEVQFVEEDAEPAWIADPTPSPSPEPSPVRVPTPKVPTPVPSPPPREPSPEPVREPTPKPRTPTPEPTPVPSPEPVREPTPPPPPRTPTPPPPPREPTPPPPPREPTPPPPPREPTPEPEPEPEPVVVKEEEPLIQETKPKKLTAAELEEQKRRAYSEEAWRRYQEYQKQWKKFRATQKPGGAAAAGTATTGGEAGPSTSTHRGGGTTGTRGSPGSGGREEIKQLKKTVPGWAGVSSRPTSATGGSTTSSSSVTPNRSPSRTPTTSMSREPSRTTMSRPTSSATSRAGSRPPSTAPSRSASNASGRGGRGRSPATRGNQ